MELPLTWSFPRGVPADASCFEGHFPMDPIVPGAYLLALAQARLENAGWQIASARRVKFQAPLRPGEAFELHAVPSASGATLRWLRSDTKIAEASVMLHADSALNGEDRGV